jgi:hypothetical protein
MLDAHHILVAYLQEANEKLASQAIEAAENVRELEAREDARISQKREHVKHTLRLMGYLLTFARLLTHSLTQRIAQTPTHHYLAYRSFA